ncbi:hypothetical protein [Phenylobacterium sp.]|uniref:hypothetical protein n=1 Tax=Phenylobacterium sp. TaxID=1871053 RepID=UPI002E35F5F0|nr:hypothetical protein [Phenylobacterium sp.]HEX4712594.1 hypothetical protein [Phenylobacterium sp.]
MGSRALAVSLALSLLAGSALSQTKPAPYHAPRTAYGQPDLQGNWTTATITPLTRDAKYGTRNVLTKQEADALEQATREQVARADAPTPPEATVKDLKNADCGPDGISGFNCGYNQGWKDPGTTLIDINGEKRASIITSPANGQFPRRVASNGAARGGMRNRTDNPEGFSLGERCLLSFGSSAGPPMLPLMYNNTYQIVQTRDEVAIDVEMVHDVRHIRLNASHGPAILKLWMGDSIGHWEGDTLVVETTNMRPEQSFRGGSPNQKVTERFTRIGPNKIAYRFTIEDPGVYAEPISGEVAMNTTKGQVYEYACHEGNYALSGMLAGARAEEKSGREARADGARKAGGGD